MERPTTTTEIPLHIDYIKNFLLCARDDDFDDDARYVQIYTQIWKDIIK